MFLQLHGQVVGAGLGRQLHSQPSLGRRLLIGNRQKDGGQPLRSERFQIGGVQSFAGSGLFDRSLGRHAFRYPAGPRDESDFARLVGGARDDGPFIALGIDVAGRLAFCTHPS